MNIARKLLDEGNPMAALDHLKEILPVTNEKWRIHELIGAAFHDLCDPEGAAQAYFNSACTDKYLRSQRSHFSNYLFVLHYLPQLDAKNLINELKIYNSLYRDTKPLQKSLQTKHFPLKIAFLAPNFCDSSAARFYESLLTDFNREKFYVTTFSLSKEEDYFTKKIKSNVNGYFDISELSFEESAEKIRDLGTDILFDLGGHTEGGATLQIAVYRPAHLQITGIGYFDSTGTNFIDYFVGDEFLTAYDKTFTEKILDLFGN